MAHPSKQSTRREFLSNSVKLGAGSLILGSALTTTASGAATGASAGPAMPDALPELPTRILIDHDGLGLVTATRQGARFTSPQASVELSGGAAGTAVRVTCPAGTLNRIVLRWETSFPVDALFLGDHWERGYGDLQWRHLQPERVLPWYFAAHHVASGRTFLAGVKTQPAALCFWTVDAAGVSLWLDFRNGGSPSRPGSREIAAATIVSFSATDGETPLAALTRFCRALCPTPRLAAAPICGNNNWYYAYGQNTSAAASVKDAAVLAELMPGRNHVHALVLYGGSVEPDNIRALAAGSSIDGFLIGHASVDPRTFSELVKQLHVKK